MEGIFLTQSDYNHWLDIMAKLDPNALPSMQQDLLAKRVCELDLFAGTICELGQVF